MRAVTIDRPDLSPALREDLPAPTPADNEVLVRVHASSVNPADNSIAAGVLAGMGLEHEYPVILGRDYAGTVEQTGAAVSGYRPGDHVYGFLLHANPTVRDGAWAELITVSEELSIAPAPDGIGPATAGVAPLAGITAMTAIDALDLSEGDVLLVAGATGGVGSLAVQLAARAGARILAPALPEDEAFLRELGASDVLPRDGDIAQLVRERYPDGVDALLDLVNYAPGTYDAALKAGARVASPTGAAGEGPGRTNLMAAPSPQNLRRLGTLLTDGTLRIPVQATYELAQAPEALVALTGEHTQGKLAIQVR
ncbi:MAG TPA: NADP-dependent oxidoreductase [Thermoleophilaceae bacterium]|nr:NADP-dependent oxidoreductase [Thermoleophilaceae bacterium]